MKGLTASEKKQLRTGLLFISPWIIGVVSFTLIPLILAFGMSLTNYSFLSPSRFIGLENYITMFTGDPLIWKSLGITLLYAVVAVPLQLIFGFLLANLLNQRLKGITVFRTIFYIPCLIVVVSSTLLWRQMLDTDFGIINYLLSFLGIGIQEPMSSWGKLLQSAQSNLQNAIYMALIPGLLIMFTIFAFNKLGNLLRIYVDPRVMDGTK